MLLIYSNDLQQWCPVGLDKNEQPPAFLSDYWLNALKKPYLSSILAPSFPSQLYRHSDC